VTRQLVIDASVAIKWLIPEADSEFALAVLEQGFSLAAPDLLLSEIGNVLWRKSRTGVFPPEAALRLLNEFQTLSIQLMPSARIAPIALGIAQRCDRSYYDSLYLALAETLEAPLITADQKFWNALQTTPYRDRVVRLGTVPV
jgi:predicted nucleic acid-binding protein